MLFCFTQQLFAPRFLDKPPCYAMYMSYKLIILSGFSSEESSAGFCSKRFFFFIPLLFQNRGSLSRSHKLPLKQKHSRRNGVLLYLAWRGQSLLCVPSGCSRDSQGEGLVQFQVRKLAQRCDRVRSPIRGFQGARARVSKGLRPPHLNNNQDKTKNGFRRLPFHVVATSETDLS